MMGAMDQNQNAGQGAGAPQGAPPSGGAPMPSHDKNVAMAVLAYLSILVLVPYLTAKNDPFVHFHVKQGATLFGIEVLVWIVTSFLWFIRPIWLLAELVDLVLLVLVILGIVNAVKGEQKPLPLVGDFASGLNI